MEQNYKSNSFKKLLDRLQEQSWQLELLISGFAIFGLFYAVEPTERLKLEAWYSEDTLAYTIYLVTEFSINILIFNLVLHVVLRSLWIGALGLRYVSGEIYFNNLNYSNRFTKHLKRKIGSFDEYIGKLENICSIIFAISFLLIFYIISFFILMQLQNLINSTLRFETTFLRTVGIILYVLFLLGVLLTFIDFITQGLLKRNKWLAKLYFPFFWFFSFLTLSFLYRPLSYNLLDNKFGKKISFFLLPMYLSVLFVSTLYKQKSSYISVDSTNQSNTIVSNSRNYENLIQENDLIIDALAIQSKVIKESFVKVNVPLSETIEDRIIEFNESLKPKKDKRGYKTSISISSGTTKNKKSFKQKSDSLQQEYIKTFNNIYSIKIDSSTYKSDFLIVNNDKKISFESYFGIKNIVEGKHILCFQRKKHKETDSLISIRKIPFWYFEN